MIDELAEPLTSSSLLLVDLECSANLFLEAMVFELVVCTNIPEEVPQGGQHTLSDMVSIVCAQHAHSESDMTRARTEGNGLLRGGRC